MRRATRLLAWVVAVPWALWALVRLLALDRGILLVPLIALTPWATAAAVLALLLALVVRAWAPAAVAAVAAVALLAVVVPRALGGGDRPAAPVRTLRVLTVNSGVDGARPFEILRLVLDTKADVLSVQELTPLQVERLERIGIREVLPGRVVHPRAEAAGTGLWARFPLREVTPALRTHFATAAARARVPGGPEVELYAVHARAPTSGAGLRDWHRDLRRLPSAAPDGPLRILAGDFNATLDHRDLRRLIARGYEDAADAAGAGLVPTFPRRHRVPPFMTIDHVLVDERAGVGRVSVHDVPITDHRAVLAELLLPR